MKKRYLLGALLLFLTSGVAVFWMVLRHPKPTGASGPQADALALKMQRAVHLKKWQNVRAITWNFAGKHVHVWDRVRQLAYVRWSTYEAMFLLAHPQKGKVFEDKKPITETIKRRNILNKAYAFWCNDSFWLNPVDKLFDPGTIRKIVHKNGHPHLLIEYTSGGITPGDTYYFVLHPDGTPKRWHMYVSILPIQGIAATFDSWITLPSGAKISTEHSIGPFRLKLTDIRTASSIRNLLGRALFQPLLKK